MVINPQWARGGLSSRLNMGIARTPRFCLVVMSLVPAGLMAFPAAASSEPGRQAVAASDGLTRFNIPAQPLEDALMAYAAATGVEVFVDHALTVGQRSAPVLGTYSPEAGLQGLLAGTGLELRHAADHAYTLVAAPVQEPPSGRMPGWSADQEQSRFFAALQAAVKQTLCMRPGTVPGQYRAAFAIWIDSVGRVSDVRVLSLNGAEQTARGLLDGIQGMSVGQPPPQGLEQPVTFVILPRPPDQTGDCWPQKSAHG